MKSKLFFFLLLVIATPTYPQDALQQIEQLELSSHFDQAIASAESLIASNTLPAAAHGRALLLLGSAYRELGDYTKARHSFEQAAHLFESQNLHDDYASALDHMAILDNTAAQYAAAERQWLQAARIFQQTGDRAGLARIYLNLTQLELTINHAKPARKYLDQAARTAPTTDGWLPTDVAHFAFTEACVNYKEGRFAAAVSGYQKALEEVESITGENGFMTGSMYAYLGMSLAKLGRTDLALEDVRKGLALIDSVEGRHTMRYLAAEKIYAQILDLAGLHSESVQLQKQNTQSLHDFLSTRCPQCTATALSYH